MKSARLAESLAPASYSVIGNLYSKDGINYLLRNVLARPTIRALVLCGSRSHAQRRGAVAIGPGRRRRGLSSARRRCADRPRDSPDAIEAFRTNVRVLDLRGVNDTAQIRARLEELSADLPRGAFAEPRVFPRATPAADEFPAEETGFVVRGDKIVQVWVHLLAAVLAFGRRDLTAYTVQQRELLDVVATI